MAKSTNHEDLKREAIQALEEARYALGSEVHWARTHLTPKAMAHNVVEKHTKTMLIVSAVGGFVIARLLFHSRRPHVVVAPVNHGAGPAAAMQEKAPGKKSSLTGVVVRALWKSLQGPLIGLATRELTPLLMQYVTRFHDDQGVPNGAANGYQQQVGNQ